MIEKKIGLQCSYYRDKYLENRIKLKMREKGINNFTKFHRYLNQHPDEFEELMLFITVNYSKFYRDNDVFDVIREEIIPELFQKRKRIIRILSAGCSSGEEPYTLAMIIDEYRKNNPSNLTVSITGFDIDDKCLNKARQGEYSVHSIGKLDPYYLERYFDVVDNTYFVKNEIKNMVRFQKKDLTGQIDHKYFDLILCRNVFIYFTNEAKRKIISNFYDMLNTDAYLVLGKTEMLPLDLRDDFKCISNISKVFQKVGNKPKHKITNK